MGESWRSFWRPLWRSLWRSWWRSFGARCDARGGALVVNHFEVSRKVNGVSTVAGRHLECLREVNEDCATR